MPLNFGLIADGLCCAPLFHGGTKNHRRNLRRPKTWRFLYQTRRYLNFIATSRGEKCNRRNRKHRQHFHEVMTALRHKARKHRITRMSFGAAADTPIKPQKTGLNVISRYRQAQSAQAQTRSGNRDEQATSAAISRAERSASHAINCSRSIPIARSSRASARSARAGTGGKE